MRGLICSLRVSIITFTALAAAELYDSPPVDRFLRRSGSRGTVLGDYLYIDGGEVSQLTSDGKTQPYRGSDGVNSTLSIDLTKSWRSEDVEIRTIPKAAPAMGGHALFTYKTTSTFAFYSFGGQSAYGAPVPKRQNWRFLADGHGGGTWNTELPSNPEIFNELRRSQDGAFVSTPNAGIWVGGQASAWTDTQTDAQPVPGAVTFNFTTKSWRNDSATAFTPYGVLRAGNAEYIPSFGPNGLVMMLGGSTSGLDPATQQIDSYLDFQNVSFFDPITREWHWQSTTGPAPAGRGYFCSVGVSGQNGTHEIYIFGGKNSINNVVYNDMFILSLPGFVWTKPDITEQLPRASHHCVLIGKGQMLSIGGMGKGGFREKDTFPQGLGIFDMNSLTWGTEFRVDAGDYDSPSPIKNWYAAGGLNSVQWSSEEVKSLFSTARESTKDLENAISTSSTPVAAIAGGTAGGVVLIAVIGGIVFFWSKKQKQKRTQVPQYDPESKVAMNTSLYQDAAEPTAYEVYANPIYIAPLQEPVLKSELVGSEPQPPAELESSSSAPEDRQKFRM